MPCHTPLHAAPAGGFRLTNSLVGKDRAHARPSRFYQHPRLRVNFDGVVRVAVSLVDRGPAQ